MRLVETDHVIRFNQSHGLFGTRLRYVVVPYGNIGPARFPVNNEPLSRPVATCRNWNQWYNSWNLNWIQTGKDTTITRTANRETGVSRHHMVIFEGPHETPRTLQHYGIDRLKEGPQFTPYYGELRKSGIEPRDGGTMISVPEHHPSLYLDTYRTSGRVRITRAARRFNTSLNVSIQLHKTLYQYSFMHK